MRKLVPKFEESEKSGVKLLKITVIRPSRGKHFWFELSWGSKNWGFEKSGFQTDFVWLYSETNIYKLDLSFSKAPETFRVRKAIFSWSVSKNGEVYTHETSCMKRNSVHIKNVWIKPLCNRKVRNFPGLARETGPRLAKNSFCFHSLSQPNWCNLWR